MKNELDVPDNGFTKMSNRGSKQNLLRSIGVVFSNGFLFETNVRNDYGNIGPVYVFIMTINKGSCFLLSS